MAGATVHDEVFRFVLDEGRFPPPRHVLEIGGMNVNGHVRNLLLHESWHCVDIAAGPLVDEVADAADWKPPRSYDLVLCLEVFEHTPRWREIVHTIGLALEDSPDARALITCAIDPRPPHGAYGAHEVPPGEYYANPDPGELAEALIWEFCKVKINCLPRGDFQAVVWL